jgi:hypothetical protein
MEVRVSKGFLVLAQNTEDVDYIQQAYALACSIKLSQYQYKSVSLVTNDVVPENYKHVFDNIIEIPYGDQSNNSKFRAENRWKLYHASPYHETIVLDTDMLLLEDISTWWNYCSNYDLKFCNRIKNYKLETIEDKFYRKAFTENNLTSPYCALHYFKKSEFAHNFYKVLEFVCNNWEWCWNRFSPNEYQSWLSMDLAVAVAIDIMGVEEQVLDYNNPMELIHMKPLLQGWNSAPETWQDSVIYNFTGDSLTVSNIRQHKLFHYVEKDFLSDKILKKLTELVNGTL